MAKGESYDPERIARRDPTTGVEILQLTSFPVPSNALSYMGSCFTPDSRTLIFASRREVRRDAPYDLFRVDVNGARLTQLTDCDDQTQAQIAPDGASVLYMRGRQLWATELDSCRDHLLCDDARVERLVSWGLVSHDGKYFFASVAVRPYAAGQDHNLARAIARYHTDGSGVDLLPNPKGYSMHACHPGGLGLTCYVAAGEGHEIWLLDYDGSNERFFTRNVFAHSNWLGTTDKLQGCAQPPARAILVASCGQRDPEPLVEGPYFWHSSGYLDGEWIVADTNWPDEGLQLVNVRTRRFRTLCYPGASNGHPQWTHPHPRFSPDGRMVLFNSDRTGINQLYLATIPDDMRENLSRPA